MKRIYIDTNDEESNKKHLNEVGFKYVNMNIIKIFN